MAAMTTQTTQTRYDPAADVLYFITHAGPVARSVEVTPGITLEYGDAGEIVGVEILRASRVLAERVVASLHAKQAGVL